MALKSLYLYAKFKNWTLFSVASVLEVNKNSIVFRLARHLCSSTPLVQRQPQQQNKTKTTNQQIKTVSE